MSTSNPQPGMPPAATPAPAPAPTVALPQERKIIVYSHSNLFYWWPVWAVGFLMTVMSSFGDRMVLVPNGTVSEVEKVKVADVLQERHLLVYPKESKDAKDAPLFKPQFLRVSHSKNVGVLFIVVLLLVILITNIPLRGWLSFMVIMIVFFMTVIFSITHVWDTIFDWLDWLDIRMNMACYLVITVVLFTLWLVGFFFIDRQTCLIFEPGQMRIWHAIGEDDESHDTTGITTRKQRSDLFRHWVLGFGSGDLVIRTSGANPQTIIFNNVLFVGRKHSEIEELLRSRQVVAGGGNGQ